MLTVGFVVRMLSVSLAIPGTGVVYAQNFPNKPIRIVTGAPGGGGDFASRLIGEGLAPNLGQPVIVDNRGNIAGEIVSKASSDGHTVLVEGSSFWIAPLFQKTPYDPVRDFSPITLVASTPNVLVVHPSVPANSVKELIAVAKANAGKLNFSSGGTGGSAHLAGELFKAVAGIDMVHVPYRGTGPAVTALIGGEVQLAFINAAAVMPHVKSGRLKALAVASARPSALTPGLPTIGASGLPGFESVLMLGMFAPAKTPVTHIDRLNRAIVRVLDGADVKVKLFAAGLEPAGDSPQHFAAVLKSDIAKWGKVIRDAGIHE